jgi:hypothetical protein
VCAGLTASRSAIGVRRIASSLACVMPIREDGTHGDKQQKSCANRNDQVDPKIPAVTFPRHEWLMLIWPTQGADDSSVRAGLVPLESPSIIGSPLARPPSSSSPDRWVVPSGRLTLGASRQCPPAHVASQQLRRHRTPGLVQVGARPGARQIPRAQRLRGNYAQPHKGYSMDRSLLSYALSRF